MSLLVISAMVAAGCAAAPPCGDGQVEAPEVCDGQVLNGQSCASQGFGAGALKCQATCQKFDLTSCGAPATCGNGARDGVELCDGADLAGTTCAALGLGPGTVRCAANCGGFDATLCGGSALCGNGALDKGEVCDGAALGAVTCQSLGNDFGALECLANCSGYVPNSCGKRGTHFSSGARFAVPSVGGDVERGWYSTFSADSDLADWQWTTVDMNGDGKPDLVSHARSYAAPAPSTSTIAYPHGWPSDAHWLVFLNVGTGFGTGAKWPVPAVGGDTERGWYGVASADTDLNDWQWVLLDVDGDRLPDLVSHARSYAAPAPSTSTIAYPHGWPGDPHWLVFKNTGSGFATGTKWTLPNLGGDTERGWYGVASSDTDLNDWQWVLLDLDGDDRPDLVSHARSYAAPPPSTSTIAYPHGWPSDPHWLVFKNSGSGFATGAKWTLPNLGGDTERGWYGVAGFDTDLNDWQWQLLDLGGDGKPDLVSPSRSYANPAPSTATTAYPHGWPTDPHWLTFPNTGSGFGAGAKWALPATGGDVTRGWYGTASADTDLNDWQWATLDLDGDRRPDLVSTSRAYQNPAPSTATTAYPQGWPTDPHWLVFPNTGSGFGTGAKWTLPPAGGDAERGWYGLGSADTDLGDFQWLLLDLDGDGRSELVSHARAYANPPPSTGTTAYPHGWPGDAHWLWFQNVP